MADDANLNTDRELWRERDADSIFVTQGGGIGINCGGYVIVKSLKDWHMLAAKELDDELANSDAQTLQMKRLNWIISSLERVLANGHGMIPVPAKDLRMLIEAARAADVSKPADEGQA